MKGSVQRRNGLSQADRERVQESCVQRKPGTFEKLKESLRGRVGGWCGLRKMWRAGTELCSLCWENEGHESMVLLISLVRYQIKYSQGRGNNYILSHKKTELALHRHRVPMALHEEPVAQDGAA